MLCGFSLSLLELKGVIDKPFTRGQSRRIDLLQQGALLFDIAFVMRSQGCIEFAGIITVDALLQGGQLFEHKGAQGGRICLPVSQIVDGLLWGGGEFGCNEAEGTIVGPSLHEGSEELIWMWLLLSMSQGAEPVGGQAVVRTGRCRVVFGIALQTGVCFVVKPLGT